MTEQNQTPGIADDDTEGHRMARSDDDDTQGHAFHKDDDDTEGHRMARSDDEDDVQGHARHFSLKADDYEGDGVEVHVGRVRTREDGDEDVEGHGAHYGG